MDNAVLAKGADSLDDEGRRKRECPVPRPGGLVGQMMGFEQKRKKEPVEVVVRSFRSRNGQSSSDEAEKGP